MDGGFAGEVIARMTVTEDTDIVEAVRYLTENDRFSFPAVHWQMDANFWNDYHMRDYAAWVEENYNPASGRLSGSGVETMRESSRVLRWYPFIDPMQDMLFARPSMLRCGCGHANYSIMTDGHIAPCPIMVGMKDYYVGHIRTADPLHPPGDDRGEPLHGMRSPRLLWRPVPLLKHHPPLAGGRGERSSAGRWRISTRRSRRRCRGPGSP